MKDISPVKDSPTQRQGERKWLHRMSPRRLAHSFFIRPLANRVKSKTASGTNSTSHGSRISSPSPTAETTPKKAAAESLSNKSDDPSSPSPAGSSSVEDESGDGMLPDFSPSSESSTTTVDEEESGEEEGSGEDEELIPSSEVDFLLENAEQNRVNDLAALQDEFDDQIWYLAEERNELVQEKMFWQTKFVSAIKARDDFQSRSSSLAEENERLEADNDILAREMAFIQTVIDQQYADIKEIKATIKDSVTKLSKACMITDAALAKARDGNTKTARELAVLRKMVLKIEEPKMDDFTLDQDFKQALETNQDLATQLEVLKKQLSQANLLLEEREARIKKLEENKCSLGEQLDYMELYNRRNVTKLNEVERALTLSNDHLHQTQESEAHLKVQFSRAYGKWAAKMTQLEKDLSDRGEKLQLKDAMIQTVQQQNTTYLDNFKDTLALLKDRVEGDDLSLKLANCLQETLDRNELLEIELCNLREKSS